jgi:peptide-methionine (R)-S-oxide reductase
MNRFLFIVLLTGVYLSGCRQSSSQDLTSDGSRAEARKDHQYTVVKSEEEWKAQLSPEAYYVLRERGTERAFTGKYAKSKAKGIYLCAGCQNPLFSSETKFESGTGWPSFYQPISPESVLELEDRSYGMIRTEVECSQCGGHLGHVFDDGPKPTGLRYCLNSAALEFVKK